MAEVARTAGFRRAYVEARRHALESLEFLKPFPRNRYRQAQEEIALYVVDRTF